MGGLNADRVTSPPNQAQALTLGWMADLGWQMRARCRTCELLLEVDVPGLVRMHGRDAIWWGRHPRCRRVGCNGRVTFSAAAPPNPNWVDLVPKPRPEQVEQFRALGPDPPTRMPPPREPWETRRRRSMP